MARTIFSYTHSSLIDIDTTMTSQSSLSLKVKASPHLSSKSTYQEILVKVAFDEPVMGLRQYLSSMIGCPAMSVWLFHRGSLLSMAYGLTWREVPFLSVLPCIDVCIRNRVPQKLTDLCRVEMETERIRAYRKLRIPIRKGYALTELCPLSTEEMKYVGICALLCLIDRQERDLMSSLKNAILCYMREVNRFSRLPRRWVKKEAEKTFACLRHNQRLCSCQSLMR